MKKVVFLILAFIVTASFANTERNAINLNQEEIKTTVKYAHTVKGDWKTYYVNPEAIIGWNYQRLTLFDPTDFGIEYPFDIQQIKHTFYGSENSDFKFVVYGENDFTTPLYESEVLIASKFPAETTKGLETPITIESGKFYIGVKVMNASIGPKTLCSKTTEDNHHSFLLDADGVLSPMVATGSTYLEAFTGFMVAVGPGLPTNPTPANGTIDLNIAAGTISWENPNSVGDFSNAVYFGTDQTLVDSMDTSVQVFTSAGPNDHASSYDYPELAYSTTYYWKVVESDSTDFTEGNIWSFTTKDEPITVVPNPVTLVSPIDAGTDIVINGSLNWNEAPLADSYKIFFGTDNPPTNIVNGENLGNVLSYAYSELTTNTIYYWQIVPHNIIGDAVNCPIWSFTTFANQWTGVTISPLTVTKSIEATQTTSENIVITAGTTELNYKAKINFVSKAYEAIPNVTYTPSSLKTPISFFKAPKSIKNHNSPSVRILKGTTAYVYNKDGSLFSFDTETPETQNTIATVSGKYFACDFGIDSETIMYGLNANNNKLYSINIEDGTETLIGSCPQEQTLWSDFACDKSTGIMYGITTDGETSKLYSIDLSTGTPTYIGDLTDVKGAIAIAIDGTSTGYTYCIISDKSYAIDLSTGACSELGDLGFDAAYAQSMSWDPTSDNIYLAAYATSGEFRLLDKTTGSTTLIGNLPDEQYGLGFPGIAENWISLTDGEGTIAAGENKDMTLNFDATGFEHDKGTVEKTATITFIDAFNNASTDAVAVTLSITHVGIENNLVTTTSLSQNYPNPFNPSTSINFSLKNESLVSLKVYNMMGQVVANLVNGSYTKGYHTVNFNASNLTSGIYYYTLNADNKNITKKMILIK